MKSKTIIALGAIVGITALSSCKPKQTTVSGQISITPEKGETLKLDTVVVLVMEKQEAAKFLKEKKVVIESEINPKRTKLANARQNLEKVQAEHDLFFANKSYLTNSDCVAMATDIDSTSKELEGLEKEIGPLRDENKRLRQLAWAAYTKVTMAGMRSDSARMTADITSQQVHILDRKANWMLTPELTARHSLTEYSNESYPTGELPEVSQWRGFVGATLKAWPNLASQIQEDRSKIDSLKRKLDYAVTLTTNKKNRELDVAKTQRTTAKAEYIEAISTLFAGFAPTTTKEAPIYPDRKFFITCPRNNNFTVFAKAEHATSSEPERYFWLINVPNNAEGEHVFLNEKNLIEIDPDGYLK